MSSGPSPMDFLNAIVSSWAVTGGFSKSSTLGITEDEIPVRRASSSWAEELITTWAMLGRLGGKAMRR